MGPEDQRIEGSAKRYQVIPRTLSFIFHDNHVLLIKGSINKKIWPGSYNGVGGHVDKGEAIFCAARREIFEETSLTAQDIPDLKLAGIVHIDARDESRGIVLFVFSGQSQRIDVQSGIEGSLEWWKLDTLLRKNIVEDVPVLLDLISKREIPFILKYWYTELGELQILNESSGKQEGLHDFIKS